MLNLYFLPYAQKIHMVIFAIFQSLKNYLLFTHNYPDMHIEHQLESYNIFKVYVIQKH